MLSSMRTNRLDLKSSVTGMGKSTTQIFHFKNNCKLTYEGVLPETIREGEMLKIMCKDGRMLIINKKNLLLTEVFSEQDSDTTTSAGKN